MKLLCACVLLAPALLLASPLATVRINVDRPSTWRVDPQLFGSYQEEHWGDITPGVYEQYLVNPSFEEWFDSGDKSKNKTRLVFPVTPRAGVAYPWEAIGTAQHDFSTDCVNSARAQAVEVRGGTGGIAQRLALPDYRCLRYRLRVHVRGEGNVSIKARFLAGAEGNEIRTEATLVATGQWSIVETELDLGSLLPQRHLDKFGIARLALVVEGTGRAWFDQATLFPVDCVAGVYNPETIAHLARLRPTAVRWPGGNYTSGYHWRDGVGPIDARPSRPNRVWSGTEPNHVGTDEWLRFCELTGLQPVMGVGFGEITAAEAADWVEYCNGSASTPMGALRAANGHPQPYGVKYWGIGNEVYGDYQLGHSDAQTYARGYVEMAAAMKARDPSIVLIASGFGVHNDFRQENSDWNRRVLEIAANQIDFLDIHHYIYAPMPRSGPRPEIAIMRRALLGSGVRVEAYYTQLRELLASSPAFRHVGVVHYEWAVLPSDRSLGAARQTFFNALATAEQYHAFLRNGDLVRGAMLHNFSFYVNPVPGHSEPSNPRSEISRLYRGLAGTRILETKVDSPRYSETETFREIGTIKNVPEIDALGFLDDASGIQLCLLNRSLDRTIETTIEIESAAALANTWTADVRESRTPFARLDWSTPEPVFNERQVAIDARDGRACLSLPAGSVTFVRIPPVR